MRAFGPVRCDDRELADVIDMPGSMTRRAASGSMPCSTSVVTAWSSGTSATRSDDVSRTVPRL
jgi:hypothetical protein